MKSLETSALDRLHDDFDARETLLREVVRDRTDVAHADRRAVAVSEDDVVELLGGHDLIVGGDREADLVGIDRALRGVGRGGNERAADLFQGDAR